MRIQRLNLIAFGPFTDVILPLDGGEQGLHVVYGPNEAGKSSSLRALRQLLYGMPERSDDDFVHSYRKLRIGAVLQHADGEVLACIRRKARKSSLRDGDDDEPVDPVLLTKMLGGVDEETFRKRFGIDYEELVRGGRSIVQGGGELGKILFAAASGVANLGAVQKRLEEEAERLFKPRAQVTQINKALFDHQQARKEISQSQLSTGQWKTQRQSLQESTRHKEEIDQQWKYAEAQKRRLERFRDALPVIAKRRQLQQVADQLAAAPLLPENFSDSRRAILQRQALVQSSIENSSETIASLQTSLESLSVPHELLRRGEEIKLLHEERGSHLKAAADKPKLVSQRRLLEQNARQLLQQAGYKMDDLALADSLQLNEVQRIQLQELAQRAEHVDQAHKSSHKAVVDLEAQIAQADADLKTVEKLPDPADLRRALRRAERHGDLDAQHEKSRQTLARLRQEATIQLKKLPLWSGELEALEQLALPSPETMERFEDQWAQLENQRKVLEARRDEDEQAAAELRKQIEGLHQDTPSEEDLTAARRRRDEGWRLIQQVWQDELALDDPSCREFVEQVLSEPFPTKQVAAQRAKLTQAFRACLLQADQWSDRLRREASQVAEKEQRESNRRKLLRRVTALSKELENIDQKAATLRGQWEELWRPLGASPLPPKEMIGWAARRETLVSQARAIRSQQSEVEHLQQSIAGLVAELSEAVRAVSANDAPAEDGPVSLSQWMDRCEEVEQRLQNALQQREQSVRDRKRLEKQLAPARRAAQEAETDLADWRVEWTEAMRWLDLPEDSNSRVVIAVTQKLSQMFETLREAAGLTERIEGIELDAERFAARLRALIRGFDEPWAEELLQAPPEKAAEELFERLEQAKQTQQRQQDILSQLEKEKRKLAAAKEESHKAASQLHQLCQQAGCSSHEELPEIEEQSQRRRQVEQKLADCDEQLLHLAAGASLEEFIVQAEQVNADELEPQIRQLEEQVTRLREEHDSLSERIGEQRNILQQMDGVSRAAQAEEEAQNLLAQLREDSEQYARLRMASVVLKNAIERYRRRHQGAVLEKASDLFAELTLGSFCGLKTEPGETNDPVLVGVRPHSRAAVGVDGMSDGACDQLYLALRLASLEEHLRRHTPLPFIIDDILIKFDDERSAAALKALAKLSRHTQVIFFTHHEHLLGIAKKHVPKRDLFIHRLGEEESSSGRQNASQQFELAFES